MLAYACPSCLNVWINEEAGNCPECGYAYTKTAYEFIKELSDSASHFQELAKERLTTLVGFEKKMRLYRGI